MNEGLPNSNYTKKLTIEIMGTFLGMSGMDKFRSAMSEVKRLQMQGVKDAEQAARQAEKGEAQAYRQKEQYARQELSLRQRIARDSLMADQQFQAGRLDAHARTSLRIQQNEQALANARTSMLNSQFAAEQQHANRLVALDRATWARRRQVTGSVIGGIGTGVAGVGVGALVGGFELAKTGADWQTFMLQQQSKGNFGMPGMRGYVSPNQLQKFVTGFGVQSGADFKQLASAARFGSDFGFNWSTNQQLVRAASMAALPAGGDISQYANSIGGAMVNFPGTKPLDAANMITMAARAGRADPNDFTNAVARLLMMVGQFHNPALLPQALAAVSALTRHNIPPDVAAMMVYNMLFHIIKTSRSQQNALASYKDTYGINLAPDFTPEALHTKGITGILSDLTKANVGPGALGQMLPDIRGYFAALGLTNGGSGDYQSIVGQVQNAPRANPVGNFYQQYLGTTNAQAKQLTNQLRLLAITMGTDLLPIFNKWLKEDITPLVKELDALMVKNKGTVEWLVKMAPALIAVGVGFKGIGLALKSYEIAKNLGLVSSSLLGISTNAPKAGGGITALGRSATTAMGTTGSLTVSEAGAVSGASGLGMLGMLGAVAALIVGLKFAGDAMKNWGTKAPYTPPGGNNGPDGIAMPIMKNGRMYVYNPDTGYWTDRNGNTLGRKGNVIPKGKIQSGSGNVGVGTAVPGASVFGMANQGSTYNEITNPNYSFGGLTGAAAGKAGAGVSNPTVHADIPARYESVKLPGDSRARYQLNDWGWDGYGGGNYQLWLTPNIGRGTGHMRFYHLENNHPKGAFRGQWYSGGTVVALSGNTGHTSGPHLHVGMDAAAEDYVYQMTKGKGWTGNPYVGGHGGSTGLNLSGMGNTSQYQSNFQATGSKGHVDPSVLAGISMSESSGFSSSLPGGHSGTVNSQGYGDMGVKGSVYGTSTAQQIAGAGQMFDYWRKYAMRPDVFRRYKADADKVLHRLGVPASHNAEVLVITLALYNAGDQAVTHTVGMNYAYSVLATSMHANHGAFPAMYYTGQGAGRTATGPTTGTGVSSSGGMGNELPSTALTPSQRQWSKYHKLYSKDEALLTELLKPYRNPDGSVNFSKMPPAVRKAVDQLIRRVTFEQYEMGQASANQDIANPKVRGPIISQLWHQYMGAYRHPEDYINSAAHGSAGNTGRSVPVHIIGHCAAEEKKRQHQKAHAATAHAHAKTAISQLRVLNGIKTELELHSQLLQKLVSSRGGPIESPRTGGLKVTPRLGH